MSGAPRYRILYGDIHNHNGYGNGIGSIERSVDVARTHLDFFAFTGHSSWHDMESMEGGRQKHWTDGFERLKAGWPRIQQVIAEANRDGEFSAFLGFEWHSSGFGDQCVILPADFRPVCYARDVEELRRFCVEESALMIPHHLAYPRGMRGVNWDVFTEQCTPVVEIFSEHGNAEDDRGAYPYFSHSMGGRVTTNTARWALEQGMRFGFVASSDSHFGFPGAYNEGLLAALCTEATRSAIIEAVRARRTYALTGERIEVDFSVDGAPMGSSIDAGREVAVEYAVRGRDELEVVEIIQDGIVVHRSYARESTSSAQAFGEPFHVRLEWGWGPWTALALDRICDWRFELRVSGGKLLRHFPCLQSLPFDEDRRHRFAATGADRLAIRSYTSRKGAYRENPNHSVVLEVQGGPDMAFHLDLIEPARISSVTTAERLLQQSHNLRTGAFPKESYQWHRLVPHAASSLADRCTLRIPEGRSNVYLRAKQKNGHLAWASPVFVNYR